MVELTVGYVSGIIAAGVFVAQLFIPTAIALILVGVLREEQSAVSWSAIARLIHSSHWPVVLNSDSAASKGVSRSVQVLVWLKPIALALLAVAAIVTPLGLYDELTPGTDPVSVPFQYVFDNSSFGRATTPRSNATSLRMCWVDEYLCPNAPEEAMDPVTIESFSVWPESVDFFTSGETGPTVASVFDIEWRNYYLTNDTGVVNGSISTEVGYYRQLSKFILDEALSAVEGLVVDSKVGRIGFRNHTIPADAQMGVAWTEDILFVEPETRCVDTNLTMEYTTLSTGNIVSSAYNEIFLVDHGGFVNLAQERPPGLTSQDFQIEPELYARAYSAAWHQNMMLMQYFNISTNGSDGSAPFSYLHSHEGKKYNQSSIGVPIYLTQGTDAISTMNSYGRFIGLPDYYNITSNTSSIEISEYEEGLTEFAPNPWNLTKRDFDAIGPEICGVANLDHHANMSAVSALCGLFFGGAERLNGGEFPTPNENTNWRVPMYSCSMASKAIVREISFSFNGSDGLQSLIVNKIGPKKYRSDQDLPLWGVERLTNHTIHEALPLWGVVSPEIGEMDDVSTIRREHIWLPGHTGSFLGNPAFVSSGAPEMAGTGFYTSSISNVFQVSPDDFYSPYNGYSGRNDIALYEKWLDLSRHPADVELAMNLIFTDISANSVVGTKGWLSDTASQLQSRSGPEENSNNNNNNNNGNTPVGTVETASVPVFLTERAIRYQIGYAVPAFITLLVTALLFITVSVLIVGQRTGPSKMGGYLTQTSSGRILGTFLHPSKGDPLAPTDEWIASVGVQPVKLRGDVTARRSDNNQGPFRGGGGGPIPSKVPAVVEETDRTSENYVEPARRDA